MQHLGLTFATRGKTHLTGPRKLMRKTPSLFKATFYANQIYKNVHASLLKI